MDWTAWALVFTGGVIGWIGSWISSHFELRRLRETNADARTWEAISRGRALAAEGSALLRRLTQISTFSLDELDEPTLRQLERAMAVFDELSLFGWSKAVRDAASDIVMALPDPGWKWRPFGSSDPFLKLVQASGAFRRACQADLD